MTGFISFADQIRTLLSTIVDSHELHAKWLNTLSYLENCGARKIASYEHPTLVKEEILKHAAEEFRHAHYLKRQIGRVSEIPLKNYSRSQILGGISSLHYLNALDLEASRYLKDADHAVKEAAYLLVTYAIELRAAEIYPIYDEILKIKMSKVTVKSILLEEKEHLREMEEGLEKLSSGFTHAKHICAYESTLCKKWLESVKTNCLYVKTI